MYFIKRVQTSTKKESRHFMNHTQYGVLKNALNASSMRQKAISGNIANVNTPGYKVNKVEFERYLSDSTQTGRLLKKHPDHFGVSSLTNVEATIEKRTNTTLKEDGNNVDIDFEMAEMAANALSYQALITQLNANYSMFRTVIK